LGVLETCEDVISIVELITAGGCYAKLHTHGSWWL